jgi:hypothetical protein
LPTDKLIKRSKLNMQQELMIILLCRRMNNMLMDASAYALYNNSSGARGPTTKKSAARIIIVIYHGEALNKSFRRIQGLILNSRLVYFSHTDEIIITWRATAAAAYKHQNVPPGRLHQIKIYLPE